MSDRPSFYDVKNVDAQRLVLAEDINAFYAFMEDIDALIAKQPVSKDDPGHNWGLQALSTIRQVMESAIVREPTEAEFRRTTNMDPIFPETAKMLKQRLLNVRNKLVSILTQGTASQLTSEAGSEFKECLTSTVLKMFDVAAEGLLEKIETRERVESQAATSSQSQAKSKQITAKWLNKISDLEGHELHIGLVKKQRKLLKSKKGSLDQHDLENVNQACALLWRYAFQSIFYEGEDPPKKRIAETIEELAQRFELKRDALSSDPRFNQDVTSNFGNLCKKLLGSLDKQLAREAGGRYKN